MTDFSQGRPGKGRQPLSFTVEGKSFETFKQYLSGEELKRLANIPLTTDLYLAVQDGYEPELINNDKEVDLARTDLEHFFVTAKLKFTINGVQYISYEQYVTGKHLRQLGNISEDDDIFLKIDAPFKHDLITDDEEVDLARPGKEHFFSQPKTFNFEIIVNGRPKVWNKKTITFDEVIHLSGGNTGGGNKAYTVTYSDGPNQNPEGEMAKGDVVVVTNKMIFNATATDKS